MLIVKKRVRLPYHRGILIEVGIAIALGLSDRETEMIPIGSGATESLIKQIDARMKRTGAQWKQENVPQALSVRCAYLNGLLSV